MDPEPLGNTERKPGRKVRFAPKGPPRRAQKAVEPKAEKIETADDDAAKAQELLRLFNESSVKVKPKAEKKSAPSRVAFGYGGASTSMKSYGVPKSGPAGGAHSLGEKEYKEPWDYYSYYPVTLPLRRPYSGNPELLNEEEFGESSESMNYDENSTNHASELGLMDEDDLEAKMIFLQLPATLPIKREPAKAAETDGSAKQPKSVRSSAKTCSLNELPEGFMGKMLIYKSGAIKLKLGDNIYDVSAGLDSVFAQDVVAINTEEKHFCVLGELNKRGVISPDVDSILNSMLDG